MKSQVNFIAISLGIILIAATVDKVVLSERRSTPCFFSQNTTLLKSEEAKIQAFVLAKKETESKSN